VYLRLIFDGMLADRTPTIVIGAALMVRVCHDGIRTLFSICAAERWRA
jgi:hypothetical protein